ncbi:MAG: HEAT repeat domain-containing protein [Deltaproteobacteria bacterium]|nr:HEAT repeat domain-containing protein [Deltaproteobacteria bacterium]
MLLPITNFTDDECKDLWQRLRSENENEMMATLQFFVDNPGSFDALTDRMKELSDGLFHRCDIREAVSKLARSENNIIISQLLRILDSADETIQYWIAAGMEHKYYANTVPVFLKYIGSDDEFISSNSMFDLCRDEDKFNLLKDERKNAIINSMFDVFTARYNKTVHDETIAHCISDPLYISICYLAKLLPIEQIDRLSDRLIEMTHDEQVYVRYEAVRGLAEVAKRIKSSNQPLYVSIEQVILQLFEDRDSSVRRQAFYALDKAESEHSFPLALKAAASDKDPRVQDFAIMLLRRYYPFTPKALRVLRRLKPIPGDLSFMTDFKLSTFQKILSFIPFL